LANRYNIQNPLNFMYTNLNEERT